MTVDLMMVALVLVGAVALIPLVAVAWVVAKLIRIIREDLT